MKNKKSLQKKIAKDLGSTRTVSISKKKQSTPLGWLEQGNNANIKINEHKNYNFSISHGNDDTTLSFNIKIHKGMELEETFSILKKRMEELKTIGWKFEKG